jgi:pyruvate kinase
VARLNFSHGDFAAHGKSIAQIRAAERASGRAVAIMADLPGPKMRLGTIEPGPVHLKAGDSFTLTTRDIVGDGRSASVTFEPLPRVVHPGDRLFLNDGLVQLVVVRSSETDVECRVAVGGTLLSPEIVTYKWIAIDKGTRQSLLRLSDLYQPLSASGEDRFFSSQEGVGPTPSAGR